MYNIYLVGGEGYIINLANVLVIEYEGEEKETTVRIIGASGAHSVLKGEQAVAFLHWVHNKMGAVDVEAAFAEG